MLKYLRVHQPSTREETATRIEMFRKHYNTKRPHQGLPGHLTPFQAWEIIDHVPATESLNPSVLAQRVHRYRRRKETDTDIYRQPEGVPVDARRVVDEPESDRDAADSEIIAIPKENSVGFYQGLPIGVPRTLAGRQFYRTITADELCLWDQTTGELTLMISLPVVAMTKSRKFINSYKIKGVYLAEPSLMWRKRHAQFWETLNNID